MKVKIDGTEYAAPQLDDLTFREAALIKRLTGLRVGEYADAFTAGDTDMYLGVALIAKHRAGDLKTLDPEVLLDMKIEAVEFIGEDTDEESMLPPTEDAPEGSGSDEPSAA